MTLFLEITGKNIGLRLEKEGREIGRVEWVDQNDLSETVLLRLDQLLTKNSLSLADIKDISVKSDLPAGYTTNRIAETVAATLRFALGV